MTGIDIQILGLNELIQRLEGLEELDLRRPLDELGLRYVARISQGFTDSRSPYGETWDQLRYTRARPPRGPGDPPLLDTGDLRRSIRHEARSRALEISASENYASFHQEGTEFFPARQFFPTEARGLPKEWELDAEDVLGSYIQQVLDAA